MKKLSLMFLLLVAGLYFTACGDDSGACQRVY